jgi:hypothetical protein
MSDAPPEGPTGPGWAVPGTPPPHLQPAHQPAPPAPVTQYPLAPGPVTQTQVGYGPPGGHAAYQPAWGTMLAAHKPGIIPLRPLGFGDILEGSFAALRRNPKTFLGLALLTSLVVLFVLGALGGLGYLVATQLGDTASDGVLVAGVAGGLTLLYGLSAITSAALTGILAYPVGEAVLGRRPTAGETWRHTRGMVLRLAGLCLLLMLPALLLVGGLVALVVLAFTHGSNGLGAVGVLVTTAACTAIVVVGVRLTMAAPALVLEDIGIVAALRRSWALTQGRFWRTFGVLLVAGILVGVVQQVVTFGFQVVGLLLAVAVGATLGPDTGPAVSAVLSMSFSVVGMLLAAMVAQPFTAAVTALLYTDARIRKEGFDLALVRAATGLQAPG